MSADNSHQFPYLKQAQLFGIKLGLENISAVLAEFNNPHRCFASLHVAGTNGKGSVCAMLEMIFRRHGLRTGLYTSPHLVDVRERIQVEGKLISEKDLRRLLREIEKTEKKLKKSGRLEGALTYFEILTIASFLYFKQKKVDLAVIEVGMGGRFDATNVVLPEISVITTISFDHQQYLGETIDKIAFEKAGIIKPQTPCVCGVRNRKALSVIRKKCREMNSPLIEVFGKDSRFTWTESDSNLLFEYKYGRDFYRFSPSLPGFHQGENAAIALAAAEVMKEKGWKLRKKLMIEAVENTSWPGRLELISTVPPIILDGCHNEAGARVVKEFWKSRIRQPGLLVFAVMKDKEIEKIAAHLFPLASRIILTKPKIDRAAAPEEIAFRLKSYSHRFFLEKDVPSAIRLALSMSEGRVPILVAGSLFLVGEARQFLKSYQ